MENRILEKENEMIRANAVKVFIDGVIESGSACMIEPYELVEKGDFTIGNSFYSEEELAKMFISLIKNNL